MSVHHFTFGAPARVAIVGCGSAKLGERAPLRDLYTGSLFRAARAHVDRLGCPWWVLSAGLGLVEPWREAEPYDLDVPRLRADADRFRTRTLIAAGTLGMSLCLGAYGRALGFPPAVVLEVHAGAAYVDWLREILAIAPLTHHTGERLSLTVEEPLRGLEIGQRLHWYAEHRNDPRPSAVAGWDWTGAITVAAPKQRTAGVQLGLFGSAA